MGNLISCCVCHKDFRTRLPLRQMDGSLVTCLNCFSTLTVFSESGKEMRIVAECEECYQLIETGEPPRCDGNCKRVLCSKCTTGYNGKDYCADCFEVALAADGIDLLKVRMERAA